MLWLLKLVTSKILILIVLFVVGTGWSESDNYSEKNVKNEWLTSLFYPHLSPCMRDYHDEALSYSFRYSLKKKKSEILIRPSLKMMSNNEEVRKPLIYGLFEKKGWKPQYINDLFVYYLTNNDLFFGFESVFVAFISGNETGLTIPWEADANFPSEFTILVKEEPEKVASRISKMTGIEVTTIPSIDVYESKYEYAVAPKQDFDTGKTYSYFICGFVLQDD